MRCWIVVARALSATAVRRSAMQQKKWRDPPNAGEERDARPTLQKGFLLVRPVPSGLVHPHSYQVIKQSGIGEGRFQKNNLNKLNTKGET